MILNFGKHKGRDVGEVPTGYLQWALATLTRLRWRQRYVMQRELERRQYGPGKLISHRLDQDGPFSRN
jgi:hypothetical protein